MSISALTWALQQTGCSPSTKLVLVAIAHFADEAGYCHPSQHKLADITLQSVETVRRRLQDLEAAGLIYRLRRGRGIHGYFSPDGLVALCDDASRDFASVFGWIPPHAFYSPEADRTPPLLH